MYKLAHLVLLALLTLSLTGCPPEEGPMKVAFLGASTTQCGVGNDSAVLPEDCAHNYVGILDQWFQLSQGAGSVQVINAGCGGSVPEHYTGAFPITECGARVDGGEAEPEIYFELPPDTTPYQHFITPEAPIDVAHIMFGVNTAAQCTLVAIYQDPTFAEAEVCLESYEQALRDLIAQLKADGAWLIVLSPPPPVPAHYQDGIDAWGGKPGLLGLFAAIMIYDQELRPLMPAIIAEIANSTPGVVLGPNMTEILDPVEHFDQAGCCDSHAHFNGHGVMANHLWWVFSGQPAIGWGSN